MKQLTATLILFWSLSISAQQPWDSYLDTYAHASSAKAKLAALDSILSLSFRKDHDVFITHSYLYIDLAIAVEDYPAMAKKAMNLAYPLNATNRPSEGIAVIDKALKYKDKIEDSFLLGGLYLKRGSGHFRTDQVKAVEDYTLAIEHFGAKDSIYTADAYLFRGQANTNLGNFIDASADYDSASRYFENIGDYQYMLFAKQGNVTMFSMNGFYERAQYERVELIGQMKELNLYNNLSTEYYNQAVDDRKIGAFTKAQMELIEAEKYLDSASNYNELFFAVNGLLSTQYAEQGQMDKAAHYLNLLESKRVEPGTDLIMESHYHATKATFLKYSGRNEEALEFAKMRLKDARMLGNQEQIMHALEDLYEIYKAMGQTQESFDYYQQYHSKKDSLFDSQKTNLMVYYQALYENEKQGREIEQQQANIALLEKDNDNFKRGIVFVIIAALLICGMLYLFVQQRNLKKNQMLQQQFSQELLVSQEAERRRISKELHDGLGQNLLLIKNNLHLKGDGESKKMVVNSIEEVRAISRALHPFQLQELGLTRAIENMVVQIDKNSSLFVSTEIENIDDLFSKEDALNVYRIIQESFNNIIKHSEAEATKLKIKKKEKYLNITIQDNGKGFNVAAKYRDLKTMGLKTLQERTRFLKGALKINSNQSGTKLQFNIPYPSL